MTQICLEDSRSASACGGALAPPTGSRPALRDCSHYSNWRSCMWITRQKRRLFFVHASPANGENNWSQFISEGWSADWANFPDRPAQASDSCASWSASERASGLFAHYWPPNLCLFSCFASHGSIYPPRATLDLPPDPNSVSTLTSRKKCPGWRLGYRART